MLTFWGTIKVEVEEYQGLLTGRWLRLVSVKFGRSYQRGKYVFRSCFLNTKNIFSGRTGSAFTDSALFKHSTPLGKQHSPYKDRHSSHSVSLSARVGSSPNSRPNSSIQTSKQLEEYLRNRLPDNALGISGPSLSRWKEREREVWGGGAGETPLCYCTDWVALWFISGLPFLIDRAPLCFSFRRFEFYSKSSLLEMRLRISI